MIRLVSVEPSIDEALGKLRLRRVGAIAAFIGIVRGETEGRVIEALEVEAYEEMALRELERIGLRPWSDSASRRPSSSIELGG